MTIRCSRPLTLALVMPAVFAAACASGKPVTDDTAVDSNVDDTVDTDVEDTSVTVDTDVAPDTDIADTDLVDTDVVDTDVADTDVLDTSGIETGGDTGAWWDSSDTSIETGTPQDTTDTGTDTDTDPPPPPPVEGLTIFLTDVGTAGDFGGIAAADALCNSSAARPNAGVYKALISDSVNRVGCTSYGCATGGLSEHVDWPLIENTAYMRGVDGAYVGTTDAKALLPDPLSTPIWDTNPEVWTGLSSGWTGTSDCSGWTDSSALGNVGLGNYTDTRFLDRYLQFCNRTNVLMYCAEQLPPGKIIFTTNAQPNGDLGGVAGADAACQAAAPTPGTFKALIVDGSSRVACTTSDCSTGPSEHVDWPLATQTLYYRIDSTVIGSTDANGLFLFPLDASPAARNVETWTGLNDDWTTGSTCASWTDSTAFGMNGVASAVDGGAISSYDQYCDRSNISLYCVQQ